MASICWICGLSFDGNKKLRNHMAAAPHHVLTVICPWCPGEKTCSRIGDLKRHATLSHKEMAASIPDGFFSESNGFWLATKPCDYKRVTVPTPYVSDSATLARSFVSSWLAAAKKPRRSRATWEQGWKTDKDPLHLQDPQEDTALFLTNDYVATIAPQRCDSVPCSVYSPTHPGMEKNVEYLLISMDFDTRVAVIKSTDGTWYRVVMDTSITVDGRSLNALKRRVGINAGQTPETMPPGDDKCLRGVSKVVMGRKIGQGLGISPDRIKEIIMRVVTLREPTSLLPVPFPTHSLKEQALIPEYAEIPMDNFIRPSPIIAMDTSAPVTKELSAQERATNLLSKGAMPLVPPARRDWRNVRAPLLIGGREESITWPPQNWSGLTPDQKLAAWEFAALRLDVVAGIPATPRSDLLDTYNFLALEGTANANIAESNMIMAKCRMSNFKLISAIANNGISDESSLKMFEAAAILRTTNVDTLINTLDQAGIKLRI